MKEEQSTRELRPISALVELTREDKQVDGIMYFSHERVMEKVIEMFRSGPFGNNSEKLIGYFLPFIDQSYVGRVIFERRQGKSFYGKKSQIYRANLDKCKELESEYPQTSRPLP